MKVIEKQIHIYNDNIPVEKFEHKSKKKKKVTKIQQRFFFRSSLQFVQEHLPNVDSY
jgi:hypothetical protein